MKQLNAKTVWITGASSGIGEALAYAFAKENAVLILTARNEEKLKQVQQNCLKHTSACYVFAADLSIPEHLSELINSVLKQVGCVDILINNAGMSQRSLAHQTPLANDRKLMELNFFSAITLTKGVLPGMMAKKSGHIVAISSIVGKFGFPLRSSYSASKHALQGYFESLRAELQEQHIEVTIISPGRIKTDVSLHALTQDGTAHGQMDAGQEGGMDANNCAKKIIRSIKQGKRDVLIGRKELLLVYIHKFLPFLYHRIVNKINHN